MSLTNILDDLHKNGCPIKRETLNRYIKILEEAKIIYPCYRFDPKSRKSISGEQKYYLADLGFYFAFNTDKRINYGPALENIVTSMQNRKDMKSVSDGSESWSAISFSRRIILITPMSLVFILFYMFAIVFSR